jgi:hypothetical protein
VAIPYPSSPTVGQTFTYGGITYTWNGVAWVYTQTNTPAVVGSVAVTAPITNTGTPTAPVIGINQSALSIAESQVTNLVSDLAGKANLAGGNSFTGAQVLTASTATDKPLTLVAAAGQSAALQQWQNSGGTTTSQISADGTLFASRFAYFGSVQTAGLSNAIVSVVPTAASSIPVAIRGAASQSADLQQWQNSSGGTVTRVDSNGAIASGNTILGQITSIPASTATKGLVVRGVSGQSANLFEIQNSTPTTLVSVGNDGAITHNAFYQNFNNMLTSGRMAIGTSSLPSGVQLGVYSGGTANKGLVIRGASGQTNNLQEWQASDGGTAARVTSSGSLVTTQGFAVLGGASISGSIATLLQTSNAARIALVVQGAASQSANLQEWQNSSGGTVALVNSSGDVVTPNGAMFIGSGYLDAKLSINTQLATQKGIVVRAATSQTADLQQWQNSSGGTVAKVDSVGDITGRVLRSTLAARIVTSDTTVAPMVISTIVGQTSNNTEWQTNAGTVAYMQAAGNFKAQNVATFNSQLQMAQNAGGGLQIWARATAAYSNPGANTAATYFRDGTLAGTLRFVSITGASGVEETLIDNISSGTAVASARFTGAGGVNTAGSVITSAGLSLSGTAAPIFLNGSAGTAGQVLTSAGNGSTPTWTTVSGGGSFTGGTLTSDLVLAAGSTAVEPLTFQANTSTVGTVSGAMEYDGTVFYQTSNTSPGKALATQNYYYVSSADYGPDFTVNSTAKSLLGGATVGLTVAAGTTYEYELITAISHQYVTTTSISGDYLIVSTTVSGSPVVATAHQVDYGSNTTGFTTATTLSTVRPTGNVTFMPAITSGTRYAFLRAKGLIRVTGTGTVKIYPAMQTSGASGSGDNIWNVRSGTIFKLTPVGNGTVTQVGAFA